MSDGKQSRSARNIMLLVGIGVGLGASAGVFVANRLAHKNQKDMAETVEQIRQRTQQVLDELSQNVTDFMSRTRSEANEV